MVIEVLIPRPRLVVTSQPKQVIARSTEGVNNQARSIAGWPFDGANRPPQKEAHDGSQGHGGEHLAQGVTHVIASVQGPQGGSATGGVDVAASPTAHEQPSPTWPRGPGCKLRPPMADSFHGTAKSFVTVPASDFPRRCAGRQNVPAYLPNSGASSVNVAK